MFLKIITNWGWTMYLHKENKELFRDIISIVSERKNVTTDIVEKDYYVTMILYLLSQKEIEVIFKGGTSLSKAYGVIDRFSEDIDITFKEHLGEIIRKKLFVAFVTCDFVALSSLLTLIASAKASCNAFHDLSV